MFLVGDSAYPLHALSNDQKTYDYHISHARIVVEIAFGCLKGRLGRLSKRNDMNIENVSTVIAACCILHNFCKIHGETF